MSFKPWLTRSLIAIISATLLLVIWKFDSIQSKIRSHRAADHLANSIEAAAAGDWATSMKLSLAAWQLKEGDVAILRQVFASAKAVRSGLLIESSEALSKHPAATAEDRIDVLKFYLQIGDMLRFRRLMLQLSPGEANLPEVIHLAIRYSLARNDHSRALALTEKLLDQRKEKRDLLLAAEVYLRIPTAQNRSQDEALKLINDLFDLDEHPAIALAAFDLVRQAPESYLSHRTIPNATKTLREIEAAGTAVPASSFLLARRLELLDPSADSEAIIDDAITRFAGTAPLQLGEWLLELGHAGKIDQFLSLEEASSSGPLADLKIRSLMTQKRWDDASVLLSDPHPGLAPYRVYGLEAVIADDLNQETASRAKWERALEYAALNNGREPLVDLARFAAEAGNEEIRNRALTEALKRPSLIGMPAADVNFLFSYLAENDESEDLLQVSRNLLRSDPDNPTLINNVVWLGLMGGVTPDPTLLAKLDELIERLPGMQTLRATRAVSLIESKQPQEAMALLSDLAEDELKIQDLIPSDRAVLALTLKENGDEEAARAIANLIDASELLEVEYLYFAPRLQLSPAF